MKRKIIEFITNLNDGGAESLVKDYALLLDSTKFDVCILTIRNLTNTSVYKTLKSNNIKIISIYPKWNLIIKIFNKLFGKYYIDYKIKKIICFEKPNVIHAHLYVLKYLNRVSDSLNGIKLFYTCHSIPSCYFGEKYLEQTNAAKNLIDNYGMQLIALHDDMKKELDSLFMRNNTVVIKNGVNFDKFDIECSQRGRLRKQLNISEEAFVVGHVGRFTYQKNHMFLLDVFKAVKDKEKKSVLLLVGSGDEKRKIVKRINELGLHDNVIILSHRTDIPELMSIMDVFVFPSIIEGFGIVLVEAQLSKLRCIVSDKVPKATYLSKYIIPVKISDGFEKWSNIILKKDLFSNFDNHLDDYNLKNEIKKLEKLYLQ